VNAIFSLLTYDTTVSQPRLTKFSGEIGTPIISLSGVKNPYLFLFAGVEFVGQERMSIFGVRVAADYNISGIRTTQKVGFEYGIRKYPRKVVKYDGEFQIMDICLRPHWWWTKTELFGYFDYFHIGGAQSLRGYYEDQFETSEARWLNAEYKRFFIFPLFDVAQIEGNLYYSYGIGIEGKSDFANASLVVAWPEEGNWLDGKIHLVVEKGF
jgi:hypothetical protein